MARRDRGQRKRTGKGKGSISSGRSPVLRNGYARLSLEAEIQAAWSCRDGVERVAIELMSMAAGFGVDRGSGEHVVRRARKMFGWAGVAQMPREKLEAIDGARGKSGNRNRPAVGGNLPACTAPGFSCSRRDERMLGWADYAPGNSGMAARSSFAWSSFL